MSVFYLLCLLTSCPALLLRPLEQEVAPKELGPCHYVWLALSSQIPVSLLKKIAFPGVHYS